MYVYVYILIMLNINFNILKTTGNCTRPAESHCVSIQQQHHSQSLHDFDAMILITKYGYHLSFLIV